MVYTSWSPENVSKHCLKRIEPKVLSLRLPESTAQIFWICIYSTFLLLKFSVYPLKANSTRLLGVCGNDIYTTRLSRAAFIIVLSDLHRPIFHPFHVLKTVYYLLHNVNIPWWQY